MQSDVSLGYICYWLVESDYLLTIGSRNCIYAIFKKTTTMPSQVFINLAVKDLTKSMNFYNKLGFTNNPQFSDDSTKCMIWSDTIFVMIMTHEKFKTFVTKPIADTKKNSAGLFALSVESVDKVHELVDKGVAAGGHEPVPFQDYGFLQKRNIEDFDGHTWEIFFMDISKFPME
jgi:predicted lactoylglutathione lyase